MITHQPASYPSNIVVAGMPGAVTIPNVGTLSVPDAMVTFDPAVTTATTNFSGGMWVTHVPALGLADNTLISGFRYHVPSTLPGGIKNVIWSGMISTDTPSVSLQWQWAAAVYSNFTTVYNSLGVKPVDDNKASQYKNSDHASFGFRVLTRRV